MALFKSQLITQASGSVGGVTFTRTRSGMTLRARSMPVNPATQYQQVVRNAQSIVSQAWQTNLTDLQREAWTNYAAEISRTNKLGDSIRLTGQQMFVRCNAPRVQAELAIIADGPTDFTLGDPVTVTGFVTSAGTPNTMTLIWSAGGFEEEDILLVYVSRPMAITRNFFKGPFRFNSSPEAGGGSIDLDEATLPQPVAAGNKVVARIRVTYADGRLSDAVETSLIATVPVPGTTP